MILVCDPDTYEASYPSRDTLLGLVAHAVDPEALDIGEAKWVKPSAGAEMPALLASLRRQAREMAALGKHILVKQVGDLIGIRRLRCGPAKRLADWRSLTAGQSMLLSPLSDERVLIGAKHTARHLRGSFSALIPPSGGVWAWKGGRSTDYEETWRKAGLGEWELPFDDDPC